MKKLLKLIITLFLVQNMALKALKVLKTGSSPRGAFNYIATIKRGKQRSD